MTVSVSKQVMMGLQETGKTTFLAALWQVITSNEVPGALRLVKLDSDSEYVDGVHQDWLQCRPVERTPMGNYQFVSMKLGRVDDNQLTEVIVPDLSGELFSEQWQVRKWTASHDRLLREATGLLLFVHPRQISRFEVITPETVELVSLIADGAEGTEEEEQLLEFDILKVPTPVQIVDLLQFIASKHYLNHLNRVAVVISAWDLIKTEDIAPQAWLNREAPLLAQYLHANEIRFQHRVYGISAQGADLAIKGAAAALELNLITKASERIIVREEGHPEHHDITAPLKWLMDAERN